MSSAVTPGEVARCIYEEMIDGDVRVFQLKDPIDVHRLSGELPQMVENLQAKEEPSLGFIIIGLDIFSLLVVRASAEDLVALVNEVNIMPNQAYSLEAVQGILNKIHRKRR